MLPAEKTHYRKGLALGLTLAETFSIVVFILLLACAVLLRQQQFQRDAAEAQRDTAQVDLLISREMLRADSMSWGNADAWFDYARQLRGEVDTQRARAEQAESELDRARARASEAESLLAGAGVEAEVAERVVEQAAELDALKDSVAGGEQRLQEAVLRQDSLEQRLAEAEQVGQQVRQQIAERGALTAEEAREVMQQATRAERMGDSLASARNTIETLARELRDTEELLKGDSASVVDSLRTGIAESRFPGGHPSGPDPGRRAGAERCSRTGRVPRTPTGAAAPGRRNRSPAHAGWTPGAIPNTSFASNSRTGA